MNNIENAYTDLNNLISINADEIRTNNLYVDGILILPSSTNFNNINCQTLTCQTDLSSNTLYATVSIQGVPVAKFAFLDATSSIQGQFNNIISNYVSNSSLTTTLANYVSLTGTQSISGAKTFTAITKMTNDLYFPDNKSIYFTPNNLPPTTGNTTYLRITSLSNNSYIDYGNGSLYIRTANAATGLPSGQQFEFTNAGWFSCYAINCASIFNFSYIDFRSITTPSTNFLINNNTIPLLAIIGLQTALDAKLSTTTASTTYLTISNASSTYATITSLSNYVLTTTLNTTLSNYVLTTALNTTLSNYVLTTALNTTLSNYVLTTALNTTLANYVLTTDLNTTLANYVLTTALNTTLANYVLTTSLNTTLANYVTNSSLTTTLGNYVSLAGTQTISGQKSFTSFIKNTSAYYFSADGATTSSIYCTANGNPPQVGNTAYMRQFAATSTGNCYYDYANSLIFRNANPTNGNVTGYEISFSPTGSIVCGALYTAIIASFSYIDFRSITTPNTNMLFNNNMINKSVIIGLTGDLSTITTNISNLDTRVTAVEVLTATNTTSIAALVVTTTTQSTQIAALTTSLGLLDGRVTTAEGSITTLQSKTQYQNVVTNYTQFTGSGLKIMSGLNYNILLNSNGSSDFYGLMTVYNNLNINGVAGGGGGTISSTNITGSVITANTSLSVGGSSTLNSTTLTTGNLTISSGSLTISGVGLTNTFNNSSSFTAGLISTNLVSNSINYKDQIINVGNTANLYTTGGSALSFNTLNIGNLTTNTSIYGITTFYGLTYFTSMNVSGFFNQL